MLIGMQTPYQFQPPAARILQPIQDSERLQHSPVHAQRLPDPADCEFWHAAVKTSYLFQKAPENVDEPSQRWRFQPHAPKGSHRS